MRPLRNKDCCHRRHKAQKKGNKIMEFEDYYVNICVGCCKINSENRKTLPFMCPSTKMPCFCINPSELSSPEKIDDLIKRLSPDGRIAIDSEDIDQHFVQTRLDAFEDLAKKGDKTIYTLPAY